MHGPPKLPLKQAVDLAIEGILHEVEEGQRRDAALRAADEALSAKPTEVVTSEPINVWKVVFKMEFDVGVGSDIGSSMSAL